MTTLISVVDSVRLALAASPLSQPTGEGTSSAPWWASLLVGLGGALVGGGITGLATWFAGRRERVRLLNERFATAAGLLGHEQPSCRLAGVHAMAGLADDWVERRQTCIDVLCAYLRMPYPGEPAESAPSEEQMAWQAHHEVRRTVIGVIRDHLVSKSATSWQGHDLDFTGAVFDGGSFAGACFSGGTVSFIGSRFERGVVLFDGAEFSGSAVSFFGAHFSGGTVSFDNAHFSDGVVDFDQAGLSGGKVSFDHAKFLGGKVSFDHAVFSGSRVSFEGAEFSGSRVSFFDARFSGGTVSFRAKFSSGTVSFKFAQFSDQSTVFFDDACFSGGTVSFYFSQFIGGSVLFNCSVLYQDGHTEYLARAEFSNGTVYFKFAQFLGSTVDFKGVRFSGGTVDLREAGWRVPPVFDDGVLAYPPTGLLVPDTAEPPKPDGPTP